jgi:hypothetical protein
LLAGASTLRPLPPNYETIRLAGAVCYALAIWTTTFAAIGLALRFLAGFSPARRYVADASYWLYLIHLPIVIALQVAVSQFDWPWPVKFAAIMLVALPVMFASYQFLVRYNLRWIDNMEVVNNDAVLSPATLGAKPWVPNYFYHDITAQWSPNDTWQLTLGVNNIADKAPPTYTTNSQTGVQSNTDPSTYDVLGRRAFLTVAMKF